MHFALGVLLAVVATIGPSTQRVSDLPEPLSREVEVREALAAGPAEIRDGAGVYILTASGFELERPSSNGFHCLVERSQPGAFEPQCFDAVGSATLLEHVRLRARLRARGMSKDEIAQGLAEAWASGELRPPMGPGINYMLSPNNRVPIDESTVIPFGPHVMFYAPYATNADLGFEPGPGSPVFVVGEGKPGAYIIVVVPPRGAGD